LKAIQVNLISVQGSHQGVETQFIERDEQCRDDARPSDRRRSLFYRHVVASAVLCL